MKYILTIATLSIFLNACTDKEVKEEVISKEEIIEQVETVKLIPNNGPEIIECSGEVAVPPKAEISIHSPIKGNLRTIKVIEGDKVKKGQVLAVIEHIEIIKIQEEFLKNKAQYTFWNEEYKRKTLLMDEEVIPKKEFQQIEASFSEAKAAYESLKSQLNILGISEQNLAKNGIQKSISIVSPINGYVTEVLANSGMFANQDTKIFELIDNTHKHVHLNVFASDIGQVVVDQKIVFRIAGSEKEYIAKVHSIGKKVEEGNRAVHVHGHLEQDYNDLVVGTNVLGKIIIE